MTTLHGLTAYIEYVCTNFGQGAKEGNTKPTLPNYLASSTLQREK